jgi:hypothetical protein
MFPVSELESRIIKEKLVAPISLSRLRAELGLVLGSPFARPQPSESIVEATRETGVDLPFEKLTTVISAHE